MAAKQQVTFGIKTSQVNMSFAEILAVWQEADANPAFADAWLWDHMLPLRGPVMGTALEAWTLLAALAARTKRLRLGVIVTSNRLRPPAVLAKMAATVDQISGGRLIFGIGAGGSAVADPAALALVRREFDAYGIEVVTPGEAIGALAEAVAIIRRLWTEEEPFDFEGRHYRLHGAIGEPKPVQRPGPPMLIAAAGDRGLTIVAEHADMWVWPGDLEGFRVASRGSMSAATQSAAIRPRSAAPCSCSCAAATGRRSRRRAMRSRDLWTPAHATSSWGRCRHTRARLPNGSPRKLSGRFSRSSADPGVTSDRRSARRWPTTSPPHRSAPE